MKKRKYASGGNTWGTVGSIASGVFGGLQSTLGNTKSQDDKAVYGDMWADPTQRLLGDITRGNLNASINNMYNNLNNNVGPVDNDTLEERIANIPYYNKKYANKNALYHIGDNLMASAQGAISGLSYSGSPWGALVGGILGGAFNIASSVDEPFRLRKYNRAVDSYNLAQRSITDQLINNSKLSQINDYNARYAKLGGPLNTHGGNFQNGLFEVVNGGTHEQNPYEGVPMGMDEQGNPNLVEEGEYIWNDNYVFSKRMQVPEDMRKKYKLGGEMSYADAVNKVQKESEERPNDPISKRGLNAILTELAMSQEIERQKQQQQEAYEEAENVASMFADGGGLNRKDDYGSKKKPYPSVKKKDFAGGGRSYPIPTKADAIDALRLAGLHHRPDVKAKVYRKYPELKHALGGKLFDDGGPKKNHQYTFSDIDFILDDLVDRGNTNNELTNLPDYTSKQVGWQYTTPENRAYAQNWNGNLYSLPFYSTDSVDKLVTNPYNEETWYVPETYENPPIVLSAKPSPLVTGKEITVTNPEVAKIKTLEDYPVTTNPLKAKKTTPNNYYNEKLRYAPIAGAAKALLNDYLKPLDYSNVERIENAARIINRFRGYKPLSNYLAYNPENPAQYANELRSGYAAQLRTLRDLSNANPAQREALAAAMQRQYGDTIGNMLMKVADYNAKNRMTVDQANNAIDQYNSQQAANMAQVNQRGEQMYLSGITQGAAMRNALEAAQSAAVSSDYNSLFDSLGLVGKENASRNMINEMGMPFVYQDENGHTRIVYGANVGKCGGKLFKVKK